MVVGEVIYLIKLVFGDIEQGVVKPLLRKLNLLGKVEDNVLKNFMQLDISIQQEGLPKERLVCLEKLIGNCEILSKQNLHIKKKWAQMALIFSRGDFSLIRVF
jgi:hypothetical protein